MVVARWSHGGRAVVVAFRLANASFRLLFVCAVDLWWSRGGRAVVARWSCRRRAVVVAFRLANASFRLLFVCVVVLWWSRSGSVVVARCFWWSRGGHSVVAFFCRELLCSSSVCVCGAFVVVAQWFCGGAGFWAGRLFSHFWVGNFSSVQLLNFKHE